MRAVMLAALAHIASLVGVVALLVHSTAAVLAQPLYCSTWNGVTTCSSPGGYVGHESTWQGVTAGDDNQGNRWTTSRWQGIELRSSSSETTGAIAAHLRRLDPIDRSSRLVGPINPDGVAALAQTGERGSRRVRQPAGGGDKLSERRAIAALQQFDDLRDLRSAARRRWARGDPAIWPVNGCRNRCCCA